MFASYSVLRFGHVNQKKKQKKKGSVNRRKTEMYVKKEMREFPLLWRSHC